MDYELCDWNKLPDGNIWIGSIHPLRSKVSIQKANITHVLSVLRLDLKDEIFDGFQHYVVHVDDAEDENLLQYFPETNAFISKAVATGEGVLVHCFAGMSRSVTVLCAYLMYSRKIGATAALKTVKDVRSMANPNEGFLEQLALYEQMGCPENVVDHPMYQRWIYRRSVTESNAVHRAPSEIHFSDMEREVAQATGLAQGAPDQSEVELRCQRCRRTLATSRTIDPHTAKATVAGQKPKQCSHHFVEPLLWMKPELDKANVSGKLECPKCKAKVGSYVWSGIECSCGGWVVPGISLARSKVDEVKISRL